MKYSIPSSRWTSWTWGLVSGNHQKSSCYQGEFHGWSREKVLHWPRSAVASSQLCVVLFTHTYAVLSQLKVWWINNLIMDKNRSTSTMQFPLFRKTQIKQDGSFGCGSIPGRYSRVDETMLCEWCYQIAQLPMACAVSACIFQKLCFSKVLLTIQVHLYCKNKL